MLPCMLRYSLLVTQMVHFKVGRSRLLTDAVISFLQLHKGMVDNMNVDAT